MNRQFYDATLQVADANAPAPTSQWKATAVACATALVGLAFVWQSQSANVASANYVASAVRPQLGLRGASLPAFRSRAAQRVPSGPMVAPKVQARAAPLKADEYGWAQVNQVPWAQLRRELKDLAIQKECAPILLRLGWHDAGTYDKESKTGGPRAAQRYEGEGESTHGANAGLDIARGLLADIKAKYPSISNADLWALASVVGIEASGGPVIPFRPGRSDAKSAKESVEDGRLPDATQGADHLRAVFGRMGLSDAQIVALSGAHTLGRAHKDRSGFEGPWTEKPLVFDNSYFVDLINKKWTLGTSPEGNPQYYDESGEQMMLISDIALLEDPVFKSHVERYAASEVDYFKDFSSAYQQLTELGMPTLDVPWDAIRADVAALVKEKQCAPILVRLAWHDAGTYDKETNTGGPRAAQRFPGGEAAHGANAGLDVAQALLQPIADKYPGVSQADLWAFASVVATEVSGGPAIPFQTGRRDAVAVTESVEDGRLPDATQGVAHLRDVFYRMNMSDEEIVALSGAHTLGRAHADRSGFDGPWTEDPNKFDNSYFKLLLERKWSPVKNSVGNMQFADETGTLMMLPTDMALLDDAGMKATVEKFAADEKAFFDVYAVAYQKLVEGGCPFLKAMKA